MEDREMGSQLVRDLISGRRVARGRLAGADSSFHRSARWRAARHNFALSLLAATEGALHTRRRGRHGNVRPTLAASCEHAAIWVTRKRGHALYAMHLRRNGEAFRANNEFVNQFAVVGKWEWGNEHT